MSIYTTSTGGILAGWVSNSNLGTIAPGEISELFVQATFSTSTVYPNYTVTTGQLPTGLLLNRDGTISGSVAVNTSTAVLVSTSTVGISVIDPNQNTIITGTFFISVIQSSNVEYTQIYCKPLLPQNKRSEFLEFISDNKIFAPALLYRPFDSNFGKQQDLKIVLDFGVERRLVTEYATMLSRNAYKRNFATGGIKSAVAKDSIGNVIYEIIYVDIIDKHATTDGTSIPQEILYNGVLYYPPSITNIKDRWSTSTSVTDVQDPSFTKTVQTGNAVKSGYFPYIPLCFTLPGKSATIIRKITESGFKFNTFNLDIDRVVVQNSLDNEGAKYLLLSRNSKLA